ncbi:hypothetical protein Y032_0065g3627 [Ancylostoma ceylanicum]|uniref:Uncharacterized protein n=1 Tax=Ancylostoma ceylanicum TaxID=53326 RepID=A0A016U1X7_9BILA|nr:hypothetical protein Y032_0065g3627 [Ancylostoma ceylanicum]
MQIFERTRQDILASHRAETAQTARWNLHFGPGSVVFVVFETFGLSHQIQCGKKLWIPSNGEVGLCAF